MSKDELPSIEQFVSNDKLPSVDEFLTEETEQELPSVEDFIEKEEVIDLNEESINVSGDFNGTLVVGDSKGQENQSEGYLIAKILELISEVRKDIPEIPEIKHYDEELQRLSEIVDQVRSEIPEVKYYEEDIERLSEIVDQVRSEIPEVKYYDEELERLCEIVDQVRSEIPEVKYYEKDIERLEENIQEVKNQIPTFPKWVNEVNEVPDFSWIGKTFSVIDDDFIKVNDKIETLKETLKLDLDSFIEENGVKFFESKVEIQSNIKEIDEKYQESKDRIWKELRESSLKIWEYYKEFKDDDRKLKKQITNEYNILKNNLEKKLKEFNENSVKTDQVLLKYFEALKEEISGLPKVKYYDDDLRHVTNDIKDLYSLVETIKTEQKSLQENLLTEPPTEKESIGVTPDPLTPMDQKFATLDDLANHYRIFINRIQQQLATIGGGGETQLKYLDDIVGIATNASVYDQKVLTYDHSIKKFEFRNIPENAVSIAEENIVYVAKDGSDSNDGTLTSPKLTIKAAVESIVSAGVTDRVVRVAPGTYIEDNPIILPDEVTVIGQSLRETTVIPQNDDQDLFYVGNGNYIAEMSFRGSLPNKAIVAFDPTKPRYINQSPYIQNCTNFIPDSIGIKIDGNAAIGPIKSMVLDSYTQYNQGGIGASITNQGYAQLVSLFTICDDIAIYCGNGGACDLTNSNSSFGNYGLVADGVSPKKYSGIITSPSASLSDTFVVDLSTPELSVSNAVYDNVSGIVTITTSLDHNFNVGMGVSITGLGFTCSSGPGIVTYPSGNKGYTFNVNQVVSSNEFSAYVGVSTLQHTYVSGGTVKTEVVRPYDGQVIYFNDLYNTVKTIAITDGGSGYTSPPIVTIDAPSASWGVKAKAIATVENGAVTQVDLLSNGRGYTTTPSITFSAPQTGINTAIGAAILTPEYYTINKSTEISNGISTITLNENVPFAVGVGTTVNFFKQSRILATGHSFEFIGSGTDIANSIPFNGGSPPIPENETDSRNGGLVVYTSTNQSGNFKIGDGVTINQNTSSITGQAYEKSLVSTMTPYILSLGAL